MSGNRKCICKLVNARLEFGTLAHSGRVRREELVEVLQLGRLLLHLPGDLDGLINHFHHFLEVGFNKTPENGSTMYMVDGGVPEEAPKRFGLTDNIPGIS